MSKRAFHKNKRVDASTDLTLDKLTISDTAIIENLACDVASIDVLGSEDVEIDDGVLIGGLPYEASFDTHTHSVTIKTESAHGIGNSSIELYSESGTYFGACVDNEKMKYGVLAPQDGGHGQIMHTGDEEVRIGSNNTTKLTINDSAATTTVSVPYSLGVGSGSTTTVTYWEGINSSFNSSFKKFGTHSLYCPPTNHTSGFTATSSGVFNATNFASSWTIEMWYYPIATVSQGYLLSNFGNACNGGYIQLLIGTSTIYSQFMNWTSGTGGGTSPTTLSGTLTTGAWNHVALGYNASGTKYFLAVNGTYSETVSAIVMDYSEIFQNGNGFSFGNAMYFNTTETVFQDPVNGYIDEVRFSKVARYTANFTPSDSAFVSDSNTFFLHHLNGSLIGSSQETPSVTSTAGITSDSSGSLTVVGNITSQVGGFSTVTGDIQTTRGQLRCYDTIATTMGAWKQGSATILNNTSALAAATTVGCYVVSGSWTAFTSSTHLISHLSFLINTSNTNAMGKFLIFVSSKAGGGTKLGLLECHYYLQNGSTAALFTNNTTKSSNLSVLSAAITSTKNILVTSDSDTRCCWTAQMCI